MQDIFKDAVCSLPFEAGLRTEHKTMSSCVVEYSLYIRRDNIITSTYICFSLSQRADRYRATRAYA